MQSATRNNYEHEGMQEHGKSTMHANKSVSKSCNPDKTRTEIGQ